MIDMVGRTAREHAIKGLKQTKIETGDYALILDPMAIGFVFSTAIGGGANADSVQRKRSYLADSCGKTIGAEAFSVIDDPTLEWATGSRSFDGEGVPSRKRVVVDHGVLRSYLYDSYSAGKDGIASTGNSSRGGSVWSYRHPPSISTSNMVIGKGDSSLEEMIEETKNGVYLRMTFDYPNLATGEFSGLMMESYSVRNGEVGPSIRQSTVGIGLLEMFKRIDMVGKKRTNAFGVLTPPLRISEARVGGSA
jgi:PmbA protein